MRIFFIIDETLFFLPNWSDKVIEGLDKDDKVIGLTPLVTKNIPTFYNQVEKIFFKLPITTILKLVFLTSLILVKKFLFFINLTNTPVSVTQVAKKYRIRILPSSKVNNPDYLKKIDKLKPDLIISSCSQIFHDRLLELPKIACINRHSALLPSYKGVFPIFWAILSGEKQVGVTVHFMKRDIDAGKIIYQTPIEITKGDSLFYLYEKAYRESIKATLEAIQIIKHGKKPRVIKGLASSYYSFPTEKDWEKFLKKGHRFI